MENWKHILGGLYEPVDKLQGIGEDDGWLIYDKIGRRTCVLKKRELASKELYEKLREMENPHLPELYRLMEQEGYLWVIEEHIEGSNLSDRLTYEGGAMEEELAVHVLEGLCRCLAPLHRRGIIHRDIKPANIMLDKSGQVKLVDFGIARQVKEDGEADTEFLGTKGYAPPEQYGFGQTDARSDIYSLGVTMQRLLGKEYRGFLQPVLSKCTALDPVNRYGSVEEILAELDSRQGGRNSLKKAGACFALAAVALLTIWGAGVVPGEAPPKQDVSVAEVSGEQGESVEKDDDTKAPAQSQAELQSKETGTRTEAVPSEGLEPETVNEAAATPFRYPFLQRSQCTFTLQGRPLEEGLGIPAATWQQWDEQGESRIFPTDWTVVMHIENASAADFTDPVLEISNGGKSERRSLATIPSGTARDIAIPLGGSPIPGRLYQLGVRLEEGGGESMYWNFQFYLER